MSRTINTDPYEVQQQNGRVWWNTVSQRDLRMVSIARKIENKRFRSRVNQAMRNGDFDNLPRTGRDSSWW